MFNRARKDENIITDDWRILQEPIKGVAIREVKRVPRDHGVITEMYRDAWAPTGLPVHHAYQSRLYPGAIGAWSCHARSIDRLFVNQGHLEAVLYDGREDSPTHGSINEYHVGDARPALIMLPAGTWHGPRNLGANDALVINFPTVACEYDDPDHYQLPFDAEEIPYKWSGRHARTRGDDVRSKQSR